MRRCPACDEDTDYNSYTCEYCGYADPGWQDVLRGQYKVKQFPIRMPIVSSPSYNIRIVDSRSRLEQVIPISSFCDGTQLAYELRLFDHALQRLNGDPTPRNQTELTPDNGPVLRFDYRPMAQDWDASVVVDEFTGDVLPANVGVLSLLEVRRCIEVAARRWQGLIAIEAILPPADHPVTDLLLEANLIPPVASLQREFRQDGRSGRFGALETVLPAYTLNAATKGMLPDGVYNQLDNLVAVGRISQNYSRHLRGAIMELADNGYRHGNGECTIAAFMRNESLMGEQININLPLTDTAARQIHLYVSCYTLGPTLAEKLGTTTERDAVKSVLAYQSANMAGSGLGLGLAGPLCRARDMAEGTIVVTSGNYSRIDMPNGIVREWTAEAGIALPGVHICLLVPLANIASMAVLQAS